MSVRSVAQLGAELDMGKLHIFWDLGNWSINPEPLMISLEQHLYESFILALKQDSVNLRIKSFFSYLIK